VAKVVRQSGETGSQLTNNKDIKSMNPIAIELIAVMVEEMLNMKQQIFALQQEENREVADDATLAPRLNELLARLQMQLPAPPTLPEMPADM
jgi:hypothetical protein